MMVNHAAFCIFLILLNTFFLKNGIEKTKRKVEKTKQICYADRKERQVKKRMIFENNQLVFRVIDVLSISGGHSRTENTNRHFCALSFREKTDAKITWHDRKIEMQPQSITFFPADVDYIREATVDQMTVIHFEIFNYTGREIETFVTDHPDEIRQQFRNAYVEWKKNRPDRQYRVTAMLCNLFAQLNEEYTQRQGARHPLLARAMQYIGENFTRPDLSIDQAARYVGVCPVYLRRIFQQELQLSPKQYLTRLRLQYAASLLDSGYYAVAEVAKRAGFTDEKYFSTVFRRSMGCSPSKYQYQFGV